MFKTGIAYVHLFRGIVIRKIGKHVGCLGRVRVARLQRIYDLEVV